MMKYLVLAAVIAVVWALWRSGQRRPPPAAPRAGKRQPDAPEAMVRCARCGVHLPQSQALLEDGRSYCCDAHRRDG
ncbi:PP0621 family protein [Melaminivora suipulveris]